MTPRRFWKPLKSSESCFVGGMVRGVWRVSRESASALRRDEKMTCTCARSGRRCQATRRGPRRGPCGRGRAPASGASPATRACGGGANGGAIEIRPISACCSLEMETHQSSTTISCTARRTPWSFGACAPRAAGVCASGHVQSSVHRVLKIGAQKFRRCGDKAQRGAVWERTARPDLWFREASPARAERAAAMSPSREALGQPLIACGSPRGADEHTRHRGAHRTIRIAPDVPCRGGPRLEVLRVAGHLQQVVCKRPLRGAGRPPPREELQGGGAGLPLPHDGAAAEEHYPAEVREHLRARLVNRGDDDVPAQGHFLHAERAGIRR